MNQIGMSWSVSGNRTRGGALGGRRVLRSVLLLAASLVLAGPAGAAVRTFTNGDGTGSWHDAGNWRPGGVPGPRDDVVIPPGTAVVHSRGTTSVASLSANSSTLVVTGGELAVAGLFDVVAATLDYQGGVIGASPRLRSGAQLAVGGAATAPAQFVAIGATFSGTLHDGQEIWVQGSGAFGTATLSVAAGATNAGLIRLESVGGGWTCRLEIPGGVELAVTASGAIEARAGTGGPRTIIGAGDLLTAGSLLVDPGITLAMNGAGRTLRQTAGELACGGTLSLTETLLRIEGGTVTGAGLVFCEAGGLVYSGGAISTSTVVRSGTIDIASAIVHPSTIVADGACTLLAHDSAATTIVVQGNPAVGTSELATGPGAANHGTIRLQSSGGGWACRLLVPENETFVNHATGAIESRAGTGGPRQITGLGDLHNEGAVFVETGTNLEITGTGRSLRQISGSITCDGTFSIGSTFLRIEGGSVVGTGLLFSSAGGLLYEGGVLDATTLVRHGSLEIAATATDPATIVADGSCTLVTNDSPGATIVVQGNGTVGVSTLAVEPGAVNRGAILLQSSGGGWGCRISIPEETEFVNEAGASIEALIGTGGPREIIGAGDLRNEGAIVIDPTMTLVMDGPGRALTQVDGSIECDGAFLIGPAAVTVLGGSIEGAGLVRITGGSLLWSAGALSADVRVRSGSVETEPSATIASTIGVEGTSTLIDNGSPAATLRVRGTGEVGSTTLTAASGASNHGQILLDSIGGGWGAILAIPEGEEFVNHPTASIEALPGNGGPRTISGTGDLRNEGILLIEPGVGLTMHGSGRTFAQAAGALVVDGSFELNSTAIDFSGGSCVGSGFLRASGGGLSFTGGSIAATFFVRGGSVEVGPGVASASTAILEGTVALLGQASPLTTLRLLGNGGAGAALLQVGAATPNAGRIVLDSQGGGWASQIAIAAGETFVNQPTGEIVSLPGSGGPRGFVGAATTLRNEGVIEPSWPVHLAVAGAYEQTSSGTLRTKFAGAAAGQHARLAIVGSATLAGGLELGLVGGYIPLPATQHTFLTSAARSGVFETITACDSVTVTYTATSAAVSFSVSGVFADLDGDGVVGGSDLGLLLAAWGSASCGADLNGDGVVDGSDLGLLLSAWG